MLDCCRVEAKKYKRICLDALTWPIHVKSGGNRVVNRMIIKYSHEKVRERWRMRRGVIIIYRPDVNLTDPRKAFRNTPCINKPKISRDVSSHTKVKIEPLLSPIAARVRASIGVTDGPTLFLDHRVHPG